MSRTSRRQFAKSLAVAAAAMPLTGTEVLAQTPAPQTALAKALSEVVRAQYGAHLNADELAQIDKDFQELVPTVERLRQVRLANADEPDFTFASLVERW